MSKNPTVDINKRLNRKTIKDPETGCWLWQGAIKETGYGVINYNYKMVSIHRLSAHLYLGMKYLFDKSINVNHKCRNRNCWNPEHLYIGNQSDNMWDASREGTHPQSSKMFCSQGHEYTEENTYSYGGDRNCKTCAKERSKIRKALYK